MTNLPPGFVWLAAGILLAVLEAFAPGAFMVWIGLAAIGTGLLTVALTLSFAVEVLVFAALAVTTITAGLVLRRRRTSATHVNAPGAGLVGRTAHALAFEGREGRVRLGDSDWPARLAGSSAIAPLASARLEVVGIDGTVLLVRPMGEGPARSGSSG